MRLELNLNKYYDGLDISKVNIIFSAFSELKTRINQLSLLLNYPDDKRKESWQQSKDFYRKSVFQIAGYINDRMISFGREELFDLGNGIEDTDFNAVIERYDYLMSKPE